MNGVLEANFKRGLIWLVNIVIRGVIYHIGLTANEIPHKLFLMSLPLSEIQGLYKNSHSRDAEFPKLDGPSGFKKISTREDTVRKYSRITLGKISEEELGTMSKTNLRG